MMPEIVATGPERRHLRNEAQIVQNSALGAILIWRFVAAYEEDSGSQACPLPLAFVILPILYFHSTRDAVASTRPNSPLGKLLEKFDGKRGELLAIHDRMIAMKALSLRSIQLAVEQGLLTLVPKSAGLVASRSPRIPSSAIPERLRPMIRGAEKLGGWLAPHELSAISTQLRVFF